jgi:hypothetical protein
MDVRWTSGKFEWQVGIFDFPVSVVGLVEATAVVKGVGSGL